MANLQRAIEIAVEAHRTQVDEGGRAYVLHPLRPMFCMDTDHAAWNRLHGEPAR